MFCLQNMGQRFVQLNSSYTGYADGHAVLHVSQLPPNPAILAPGPALLFVVVNGVPSIGVQVMAGSGQLGAQQMLSVAPLPAAGMQTNATGSGGQSQSHSHSGSAPRGVFADASSAVWPAVFVMAWTFLW